MDTHNPSVVGKFVFLTRYEIVKEVDGKMIGKTMFQYKEEYNAQTAADFLALINPDVTYKVVPMNA